MSDRRTANLLGTLALLIDDDQQAAMNDDSGLGCSACAALVTIGHAPGETIDFLSRALGRTHSSTVRLVASLCERDFVLRGAGQDGRVVTLSLTRRGEAATRALLDRRGRRIEGHLECLSPREREQFGRLLGKVIGHAVQDAGHAFRLCRLCDGDACDDCPVEAAVS